MKIFKDLEVSVYVWGPVKQKQWCHYSFHACPFLLCVMSTWNSNNIDRYTVACKSMAGQNFWCWCWAENGLMSKRHKDEAFSLTQAIAHNITIIVTKGQALHISKIRNSFFGQVCLLENPPVRLLLNGLKREKPQGIDICLPFTPHS